MPEIIDIAFRARVKNEPTMAFSNSLDVAAYDKLEVSVSAGGGDTIQLLPTATNTKTSSCIQSSQSSSEITYQVHGGEDAIALGSPQNFIGVGTVSALDSAIQPSLLALTNGLAGNVRIHILVGRSATV